MSSASTQNASQKKQTFKEVSGQSTVRSNASSASTVGVRFANMRNRKSLAFQDRGLHDAIIKRLKKRVIIDGVDVTPKSLGNIDFEDFSDDHSIPFGLTLWGTSTDRSRRSFISNLKTQNEENSSTGGQACSGSIGTGSIFTADLDEIHIKLMNSSVTLADMMESTLREPNDLNDDEELELDDEKLPVAPPFFKITLHETDDIVLFERNSVTVPHDSDEAAAVIAANEAYDYLTVGKGRQRRTNDAETQTNNVLYKSRTVNTDLVNKSCVGTFVSNYDMFDTYADLARNTQSMDSLDKRAKIEVTTYTLSGVFDDPDEKLAKNSNFRLSSMVIERLLAGNVFREQQKRFRNMIMPDPLDLNIQYKYRLNVLWTNKTTIGRAVSCLSWCQSNSDLLAIGYGVYDFAPFADRNVGHVCVWSIKNPINPERRYRYKTPVTAVAFSRHTPQLMAVGLYNGSVEVIDITDETTAIVGKSQRITSPGLEPVWKIEWIYVGSDEELLTATEDGLVMKYTLANGPYLIGFHQIKLDRVEGTVEGLPVPKRTGLLQANRHPQAITLQIHPLKADIFFVGTDEGCLHKCSTFYPHQYAGIMQVHRGSVASIEFSPWSPKIFLTCGSDWMIRIWIEDMYEPVMELSSGFEPVRSALWCPNNSCIIACTTKTHVEIWNIRQNILKPSCEHRFDSGNVPLTICSFTKCGRSLVVGNGEGSTHMCALDDMPFPPHFQYQELQSAIYHGLTTKPELLRQVKSLGYLGYNQNDQKRT